MQVEWNDYIFEVTGNWTGRWLYLAPVYQLEIDGKCVDQLGGPRMRPILEAVVEDDDGRDCRIEAELLSLIGYKPECTIRVDGEPIGSSRVRVDNVLNPVLMLVILASTAVMLYVGPDVLQQYLPFV